ncbi:MAG: glycosyltransferase family 4 protein [Chloroflexota bacterium]
MSIDIENRTNVLLVVTLSERGGAQKYVHDLAVALTQRGFRVTLVCGQAGWLVTELKKVEIPVIVLDSLRRSIHPWFDLVAFIQLLALMTKGEYHIVHTNSTKAGILGRFAARVAGAPVIIFTAHGLVINEPLPWWQKKLYTMLEKLAASAGQLIITVSNCDRKAVIESGIAPAHKVVTVWNGLSLEEQQQILQSQQRLPPELPAVKGALIGAIANFYPTKGLATLLEAAAPLVKLNPALGFCIIGDGPLRSDLEKMILDLDLSQNVLLLGRQHKAALLLHSFDIFVMPSLKEGLPFALLEAMAAARPIVATQVGGIPEAIEHDRCGLLVAPNNSDQLAEAILDLLNNPAKAKRLGEAAQQRAADFFSAERQHAETILLYERALQKWP